MRLLAAGLVCALACAGCATRVPLFSPRLATPLGTLGFELYYEPPPAPAGTVPLPPLVPVADEGDPIRLPVEASGSPQNRLEPAKAAEIPPGLSNRFTGQ